MFWLLQRQFAVLQRQFAVLQCQFAVSVFSGCCCSVITLTREAQHLKFSDSEIGCLCEPELAVSLTDYGGMSLLCKLLWYCQVLILVC